MIELTHCIRDPHRFIGWYNPSTGAYHSVIDTESSSTHAEYLTYHDLERAFCAWGQSIENLNEVREALIMRERWRLSS